MLSPTPRPGEDTRGLRRAAGRVLLWLAAALLPVAPALAEDGYDLWLRYVPVQASLAEGYRAHATELAIAAFRRLDQGLDR